MVGVIIEPAETITSLEAVILCIEAGSRIMMSMDDWENEIMIHTSGILGELNPTERDIGRAALRLAKSEHPRMQKNSKVRSLDVLWTQIRHGRATPCTIADCRLFPTWYVMSLRWRESEWQPEVTHHIQDDNQSSYPR
jgi:hypothetical protein